MTFDLLSYLSVGDPPFFGETVLFLLFTKITQLIKFYKFLIENL